MRFKLVPAPPEELEAVFEARRAVPLVPGTEDDCCARLVGKMGFPSRDVARTWLTFLRALELAQEGPAGFTRTRTDASRDTLARAFRTRVFGAAEVLSSLEAADEPLTGAETFERFRHRVPQWERHKNPDTWEDVWGERIERILEWAVLLGLAERTDAGYRIT